jgi:hypothetical protein
MFGHIWDHNVSKTVVRNSQWILNMKDLTKECRSDKGWLMVYEFGGKILVNKHILYVINTSAPACAACATAA